jgi:hypothetical protein
MYEYGGITCDPIDSECATWNSGAALKALVSSARRPEKLELFRKTSRCTSLAMFSTVPGLASLNASLRSWNASYTFWNWANGPVFALFGSEIRSATACSFVGFMGLNCSGVAMTKVCAGIGLEASYNMEGPVRSGRKWQCRWCYASRSSSDDVVPQQNLKVTWYYIIT